MTLARRPLLATLATAIGVAALLGAAAGARAQDMTVHLVVPYPPGGPLDRIARVLAEATKPALGNVIVENKAGAGGSIGAAAVARAKPDGQTIVMGAVATHAINPWLYSKLPYDPVKDFTPITMVARVPNVLVLNAEKADALKINTLADLVRYAKANPGKLNYGSGSNGSAGHLAGEMFKGQAGVFAVHIPYAGGAAAQLALLSGQVDFNFDNLATASGNIKSGKLKALAMTTGRRSPFMPDVPTVAEAGAALGLGRFNVDTWFGLFAPAGLPPAMTQRLNQAFTDALKSEAVRAQFAPMLAEPAPTTSEEFGQFVQAELAKYRDVVKASGAKID
jgi:tripartite-type tricarboxylate transporter receptor subunit TctC